MEKTMDQNQYDDGYALLAGSIIKNAVVELQSKLERLKRNLNYGDKPTVKYIKNRNLYYFIAKFIDSDHRSISTSSEIVFFESGWCNTLSLGKVDPGELVKLAIKETNDKTKRDILRKFKLDKENSQICKMKNLPVKTKEDWRDWGYEVKRGEKPVKDFIFYFNDKNQIKWKKENLYTYKQIKLMKGASGL